MLKSIMALMTTFLFLADFARAVPLSPQGVVLQGTILTPAGLPEEASSVAFTIQIRTNDINDCLLYSEGHTLNMNNSGGAFSLVMGSGSRSGTGFQSTSTLAQVFNNASAAITPLTCSSGTSYTPASGDSRKVIITFDDGSGPQTLTQTLSVQAVPYALYADTLEGKSSADFVQVNTSSGKVLTQANLETVFGSSANMTELMALINGTSTSFAGGSSATYSGSVTANGGIFGSSAASGNLTIDSTSNATKGNVLIAPSGGNVGIGTSTPAYPLTVAGSTIGLGTGLLSMSTFGVSYGNGNNLGTTLPSSVVMGSGNTADLGSVAIGRNNTTVLGIASEAVAVGLGNSVPRDSATAIGKNNWVGGTGYFALVAGYSNSVTGTNGVAVGYSNSATADGASAFGQSITNSIANSTMIGPSDAAKMTILSSGNVGIGTSSPTNILSLDGNSAKTFWMERHSTANTAGNTLNIQAGSSTLGATDRNGGNLVLKSGTATGTGSSNIYFQTATAQGSTSTTDNAPSTKMTILGNGKIGIGTNNPQNLMDLYQSSGNATLQIAAGTSGTPQGARVVLGADASYGGTPYIAARLNYTDSSGNDIFTMDGLASGVAQPSFFWAKAATPGKVGIGYFGDIYNTNVDAALTVQSNSSSAAVSAFDVFNSSNTKLLEVRADGKVGIGSTSPTATLDVTGTAGVVYRRSGTGSAIALTDYSGSQPTITMNGVDSSVPNNLATAGPFRIYSGSTNLASASAKLAIATDTQGNVGIGTTAPQTKLDINGTVRVAKYSAEPFACDAAHDSSLAITSLYRQCICNGGTTTWVFTSDGITSCVWQ